MACCLVNSFGWNAMSFQILAPGFSYWFYGTSACVGYVDTGGAWVAAGVPVGVPEVMRSAAEAFVHAAQLAKRRAVFFGAERRFVSAVPFERFLIGQQPCWDPRAWQETAERDSGLRAQLRRGRAKQVLVHRVAADEGAPGTPLRRRLDEMLWRWQRNHPMPPMKFVVATHPFAHAKERRIFVAFVGDEPVAFASMTPIYARHGWCLQELIRDPKAPNGTCELLIDAAMKDACALESSYVTLGLVPLAGAQTPWLSWVRRLSSGLYNFAGLEAFRAKLKPCEWTPVYVAFPSTVSAQRAVRDCLAAFAPDGLVQFGSRALVKKCASWVTQR